jgi:hypothetical protein
MLATDELAAISEGIPDLAGISQSILVQFSAHPLQNASVVWINDRWFAERGLRTHIEISVRNRVCAWLLSSFAITATHGSHPRRHDARLFTAFADRYGSSSGTSPHGGSGRVATIGQFQVKGVGRTPLVGTGATWMHSHGMASMREAIYEAICGEILDAELPFGSVPVIAIIDAGETIPNSKHEAPVERRALIVRPAVLRPAHMQRAALFVSANDSATLGPGSDAKRTYDVIKYIGSLSVAELAQNRFPRSLLDLCKRLVTQAAYGDALRLYSGGLFSSNLSMSGAILDFGVGRAVDDWSRYQPHAHAEGFGQEVGRVTQMAQTILYYARKAACHDKPWFAEAVDAAQLQAHYAVVLQEVFGFIWADEMLDRESQLSLRAVMQKYFDLQQLHHRRERWDGRRPKNVTWIYDYLVDRRFNGQDLDNGAESNAVHTVRGILNDASSAIANVKTHCWRSAARLLQPRNELTRDKVDQRIGELTECSPTTGTAERIRRLIEDVVGEARRWWFSVPFDVSISSQRMSYGCTILEGVSGTSGEDVLWIEGIVSGGRLVWGDRILNDADVQSIQPTVAGNKWHSTVERRIGNAVAGSASREAADNQYGDPPEWW